jgi:hypothetical protein
VEKDPGNRTLLLPRLSNKSSKWNESSVDEIADTVYHIQNVITIIAKINQNDKIIMIFCNMSLSE